MLFIYIFIIVIPGLLIYFSAKKINTAKQIQKSGIVTNAVVKHVNTQHLKTSRFDIVRLEYTDVATKQTYKAKTTTLQYKHKPGDIIPLRYLPSNPARYAFDGGKVYWAMLILSVLLMLFMLVAAYKINEMML